MAAKADREDLAAVDEADEAVEGEAVVEMEDEEEEEEVAVLEVAADEVGED